MFRVSSVGFFEIARLIGFNGKTRSLLKLPNSHITYRFLHHKDDNLLLGDVMIPCCLRSEEKSGYRLCCTLILSAVLNLFGLPAELACWRKIKTSGRKSLLFVWVHVAGRCCVSKS